MLESLVQDARVAVRALRARPAFTTAALLTLTLGIGANTAVYSVVHGILLRPLAYAAPERLAAIWPEHFISNAELLFLQERARAFERVAAFSPGWSVALIGDGEPAQLAGARTSANLFGTLGVRPLLGRDFTPEEGRAGSDEVAIVSHALWRTRFGADPAAVGRRVSLDGVPHTLVGVMPPGFEFYRPNVEVWIPLKIDPGAWYHRGGTSLAVGRLRPGVTLDEALAELRTLVGPMREAFGYPPDYGKDVGMLPLHEMLVGRVRTTLLVLLGAAGFIVLIAAANVGNLLLVRAAERRRELAVRRALGAGRRRLAAQLLVESVTLSLAGGALGVAAGWVGVRVLRGLLPADTPRLGDVGVDLAVLGVCAAVALVTGIIFGTAPALLAARAQPQEALGAARGEGGARTGQRLRGSLVVAEVALALVLVIGAGLMLRTLWSLSRVDPGFRPEGVLTLQVNPTANDARRRLYYAEVLARVREVPGVRAVGAIHHLPLTGYSWQAEVEVEGRPLAAGASPPQTAFRIVAGDYFRAMGIPLLAGRAFDARDDTAAAPVAVISERFATRIWPGESPLGKRFRAGNASRQGPLTVVGVVGSVRHDALDQPPAMEMYRPATQMLAGGMTLAVRTDGDPLRYAGAVREAVRAVDPGVPIASVRSLEQVMAASVARPRLVMTLLLAFAAVGLALGAVGVYGVVAFAASQRVHEIGVRLALGAAPRSIVRLVLGRGLAYAAAGVALGLLAALAATPALGGLVHGVGVADPATYALLALLILGVAAAASYLPARRAARLDPMRVLRGE